MAGMKCPPARHAYIAHGKILFCTQCADVQALLLEEEPASARHGGFASVAPAAGLTPFPAAEPERSEPTVAEMEAHIQKLRTWAGVAQENEEELGQRAPFTGEFEFDQQRARVDEGFQTDQYNDKLPDAGV